MYISEDIKYIGVNDRKIDLFEGQYPVENGMAYNSYLIFDEKIAVCDTVDANFGEEWLTKLEKSLDGRTPDYLIVHHMEPDHSANIVKFTERYPQTKIVAAARAFGMMEQFFGVSFDDRKVVATDGFALELGKHTLTFYTAPMVHWPEVIVSYDCCDKVLFSADAFGKFGALDTDEDWACEARRYYFGIVGKYGAQVQALLKKLSGLEIKTICSLHGPILSENIGMYVDLYNTWSSYSAECKGVFIAYTSVYGNTAKAVEELKNELLSLGCEKVSVADLARDDMSEAVEDAFKYDRLVLATTTYNGDIFPFMKQFIDELTERSYQKRTVGFIENGTWAPVAARIMSGMLSESKDIKICEPVVSIRSALNSENRAQIKALAAALV